MNGPENRRLRMTGGRALSEAVGPDVPTEPDFCWDAHVNDEEALPGELKRLGLTSGGTIGVRLPAVMTTATGLALSLRATADDGTMMPLTVLMERGRMTTFSRLVPEAAAELAGELTNGTSPLVTAGVERLCCALLRRVADGFLRLADALVHDAETIEGQLATSRNRVTPEQIHRLRRRLRRLRSAAAPLLDVTAYLLHTGGDGFFRPVSQPWLRVASDAARRLDSELVHQSEALTELMDLFLAGQNWRLDESMCFLTVVGTIFIPLTFITSLYGMNFRYMPELSIPWAYPALLGVMIVIAVAMVLWFKRRGWL